MYRRILRRLHVYPQDVRKLVLLMINAFGIGMFLAAFDIAAIAQFLGNYSIKEFPLAIVISGFLALLIYPFIAGQQLQIRARFYSVYLLSILLVLSLILYFGPIYLPNPKWHYAMFLISVPINILAYQQLKYIHRFFKTNDQEKRYYILTDLGYYGGMSVVGFLILLYLSFFSNNSINVIIISVLGLIIAYLGQVMINKRLEVVTSSIRRAHASSYLNIYPTDLLSDKLLRKVFFTVILSGVSFWLIHYSFLSLVQTTYNNALGYSKFFGLFFGVLAMGLLFFRHVLVKRILHSYDSPYTIFVVPIIIFALVIIAVVMYMVIGENNIISRYSLFFIIFALIKFVSVILQASIERPALSLHFRIYEIPKCDIIDKFFNGPVRFLATIVGGGLLFLIIKLFVEDYLPIVILLTAVLLIHITVNFFLLKQFNKKVKDFLVNLAYSRKYFLNKIIALRERLYKLNLLDSPEKMLYTLKLAEDNYPADFRNNLYYLLGNSHEKVTSFAIERIEALSVIEYQGQIERQSKRIRNVYLKARFRKLAEIFSNHIQTSHEYTNVYKLVDSRITDNRILAANMIGALKDPKLISQLVLLLKDFRPEVKKAAFIAATNYRTSDLSPIMLEHLASTENYAYAYDVLLRIGEDGLEYLEKAFLNPKTDDRLLKRIVKLIGEFKSVQAQKLLLSKIDYTSPEVSFQAKNSLIEGGFIAKDTDKYRVLNAVVKIINSISKNMNLLFVLKGRDTNPGIINALEQDIQLGYQNIFDLLSLVYNRNVILRLREYIENEDLKSNYFGLELLDNFLDENIKSVLVPTLQFNSPFHKVKALQFFYVLEEISYDEAFDQMLVTESSQTSNYTKACILNYYLSLDEIRINEVIISCLFHQDRLIKEMAACLIYKNDVDLYYEAVERLDVDSKYYLDNSVEFYSNRNFHLLLSKINFLYNISYFNALRSSILAELAKYLEVNSLKKSGSLTFEGEPWRYPIMFIESGKVDLVHEEHVIFTISDYSIIDFGMFHHKNDNKFTLYPKEDTVFYSISREFLNLQIFDFPELEIVFQKIMNDFYESYKNFKKLPRRKIEKPAKFLV